MANLDLAPFLEAAKPRKAPPGLKGWALGQWESQELTRQGQAQKTLETVTKGKLGGEESARKTSSEAAKAKADELATERMNIGISMAAGIAASKTLAVLAKKAEAGYAAKIAPEAAALAKRTGIALKKGNTAGIKAGSDAAARNLRGRPLGLGISALFMGDMAFAYYQADKARSAGDEQTARQYETFARANLIAGVGSPLLQYDQVRRAKSALTLEQQSIFNEAAEVVKTKAAAAKALAGIPPAVKKIPKPFPAAIPSGADLSKATVPQLKGHAKLHGIALPPSARKVDIVSTLTGHAENRTAGPPQAQTAQVAKPAGPAKPLMPSYEELRNSAKAAQIKGATTIFSKPKLMDMWQNGKFTVPGYDPEIGKIRGPKLKLGKGGRFALMFAAGSALTSTILSGSEAYAKGEDPLKAAGKEAKRQAGEILSTDTLQTAGEIAVGIALPPVGVALMAKGAYDYGEAHRHSAEARERMDNFRAGKGYRLVKSTDQSALAMPKPGQKVRRYDERRSAFRDTQAARMLAREAEDAKGSFAARAGAHRARRAVAEERPSDGSVKGHYRTYTTEKGEVKRAWVHPFHRQVMNNHN